VGGGAGEEADCRQLERRSACALPAGYVSSLVRPAAHLEVHSGSRSPGRAERGERRYRQIFTDARPLPEDPNPAWNGYSSGRWEGDTLVVDSIGFRDDLWLDMSGSPLTDKATVRERIRRPDFGHLEVEVTVDDPKAYTKPWTVALTQAIVVDTELVDEICLENEKSAQRMSGKE
jgi:hypothetical protein